MVNIVGACAIGGLAAGLESVSGRFNISYFTQLLHHDKSSRFTVKQREIDKSPENIQIS